VSQLQGGKPGRRPLEHGASRQDEAFNLLEVLLRLPSPRSGGDDAELTRLFDQDQRDRAAGELPSDLTARDRARRAMVMRLIDDGRLCTPGDFFHAAMVFQHGRTSGHYHLAFELARRAADAGHHRARWLAAAAMDRWLMCRGLPQKFGTQYLDRGGGWVLYDVDATTSDEERAAWNVPPLAEAYRHADELNRDPEASS
jgi:hypothetical protein